MIREDVKWILKYYQGALKDLDKVHVLEPNNESTLRTCGNVKYMFDDYEKALQDFDKADVF